MPETTSFLSSLELLPIQELGLDLNTKEGSGVEILKEPPADSPGALRFWWRRGSNCLGRPVHFLSAGQGLNLNLDYLLRGSIPCWANSLSTLAHSSHQSPFPSMITHFGVLYLLDFPALN